MEDGVFWPYIIVFVQFCGASLAIYGSFNYLPNYIEFFRFLLIIEMFSYPVWMLYVGFIKEDSKEINDSSFWLFTSISLGLSIYFIYEISTFINALRGAYELARDLFSHRRYETAPLRELHGVPQGDGDSVKFEELNFTFKEQNSTRL